MEDIKSILKENGYVVVEGIDAVKNMIKSMSDGKTKPLCSGYGVFPGGEKCGGCSDCQEGRNNGKHS